MLNSLILYQARIEFIFKPSVDMFANAEHYHLPVTKALLRICFARGARQLWSSACEACFCLYFCALSLCSVQLIFQVFRNGQVVAADTTFFYVFSSGLLEDCWFSVPL